MNLFQAFANPNLKYPVEVISNGDPYSNIPKNTKGIVIYGNYNTGKYKIKWLDNQVEEEFDMSGGVAISLDIIQNLE